VGSGAEFVNVQPGPPRPGAVQLGPGIGSPARRCTSVVLSSCRSWCGVRGRLPGRPL